MLSSVLISLAMLNTPAIAAQTDPPIACQPKALTPAQRRRQTELLGIVRAKIQKTVELPNGFAIQLPAESATFLEAAEWVGLERRCCGFAEYALEWRLDDSVWVKLTGGPGVKEVLATAIGLGPKR